ncbi:hypothetical protein [Ornithinimicrobium flavum]|uniref:hypothetical protein n=1 Tax=Ornithinimicrobium flavum TaxID=1288636 RepID=UPI001881A4C3|nr:hypothetical protein [Ornithinimicrobium flavum]
MHQRTFDVDAASMLLNLPGYRVVSASPAAGDQPRQVLIETVATEGACPLSTALENWTVSAAEKWTVLV